MCFHFSSPAGFVHPLQMESQSTWSNQYKKSNSVFILESRILYNRARKVVPKGTSKTKTKMAFLFFFLVPRSNREPKTTKKMATHFWKPPKLKNGGPFLTNKNHFKNAIFVFVFDQLVPKGRSKLSYWVWNSKIFWNWWMQWCDQGCRKLLQSRVSCHQQLETTSQQR